MATQLSASYVRQSYQLLTELGTEKIDGQEAFEKAIRIIYNWCRKDKFAKIFSLPFQIQSVNLSKNGNELGIIYSSDEGRFLLRAVHPDNDVAGRIWTTDVQLNRMSDKTIFATRLSVTSLKTCAEIVPLSTPQFIRTIIFQIGLKDIINVDGRKNFLSSPDEIDSFIEFLESSERFMPVILITPCNGRLDIQNPSMVDSDRMARNLMGVAHVFTISPEANDYFIKRVGTLWAVYNGAVRTYYPRLSFAESNYYQHPLMTQKKIQLLSLQKMDATTPKANDWMTQVEYHIKKYTATSIVNWEDRGIEFYLKAYQNILRLKQIEYGEESRHELIASYQEQISQLENQYDEVAACCDSYADDYKKTQEENNNLRQEIFDLKAQIFRLRNALQEKTGQEDGEDVPINGTYAEIKDWVKKYYSDRITLLPRAERSLKDACFEDVELVYKALKLLATSYYKYRMGEIDRSIFLQDCKSVDPGLEESGAITEVAAGMEGDTYDIQYRGEKRRLERHLTKGNSRDRRYCLRIYFFWDDDDQIVVIGDLPYHLDTSAT